MENLILLNKKIYQVPLQLGNVITKEVIFDIK